MKAKLLYVLFFTALFSQAQVSLVKDVNPGVADGLTDQMTNYNGTLLFTGNNAVDGLELWESDGTANGTNYITSGNSAFNPEGYFFSSLYNKVFFTAGTGSIYSTDGTLSGTESLNQNVKNPSRYVEFQNQLFYNGVVPFNDPELCITDGTINNTGLFLDISNSFSSSPRAFQEFNGFLFFSAFHTTSTGRELWRTDGTTTGTIRLEDINPGGNDSAPENLIVYNNKLYFTADNGTNGRELWVTDGTIFGSQLVSDLYPGAIGSNPANLRVFNNNLIFTANNPSTGIEVFKMNAAQNITLLKNINPGSGDSSPSELTVFNGSLYFIADDGVNGIEIWKSGGFPSNTNLLKNINSTGGSTPQGFVEYFDELYFNADDGVHGRELWRTDGTNAGTVMVNDINTGASGSEPQNLTVAGDNLFFSATTPTTGRELYKYIDPSLSLQENEFVNAIELYPNPVNEFFTIKTNSVIKSVTVYDVQGKLVKNFESSLTTYNIEDITSGLYFVNIKTDKGAVTKKIMVK